MSEIIVTTDEKRSSFALIRDNNYDMSDYADMDTGVVTPEMGLPKKYWYEDCVILIKGTR